MHFSPMSLLANVYSGFSPAMNVASAVCRINGQVVPCPEWGHVPFVFFGIWIVILVALAVLMFMGMWKTFKKAGRKGWEAIIPIYNIIVLLQIIKKPLWWIVFYVIPFANAIISIVVLYHLAKAFGKGIGFTIGLIILPFVFYPILGFGEATYHAPEETHA